MYTVGRLARRAKVSADTIRFYERQGLIAAASRLDCGYHLYTDDTLRRIRCIKHAQRCGFALADISQLLRLGSAGSDAAERAFVERKQAEIRETIDVLEAFSAALECVVATTTRPGAGIATEVVGDTPLPAAVEAAYAQQRAGGSSVANSETDRIAA